MTGSTSGAGSFACTVKGGGGSGGRRGAKRSVSIAMGPDSAGFGGFGKVSLFWHLLTRRFHVKIQQGPSIIRQVRQDLNWGFELIQGAVRARMPNTSTGCSVVRARV